MPFVREQSGGTAELITLTKTSVTSNNYTATFDLSSYDITGMSASDFQCAFTYCGTTSSSGNGVFSLSNKTLTNNTLTIQASWSGGGSGATSAVSCYFVQ